MELSESGYLKLVSEFSELNLEFKVSDQSYLCNNEDDPDNPELLHWYHLIFQHDFIITSNVYQQFKVLDEYSKYVESNRVKFYREINDLIEQEGNDIYTYNKINDYKIQFQELINCYTQNEKSKFWSHSQEKSTFIYPETEAEYPISTKNVLFFKQAALKIQKEAIQLIINNLLEKLAMLELFKKQTNPKVKNLHTRSKDKLTKLDIYQTALFFDYLTEAGIIHKFSFNIISRLVSELTGHSNENLRSFCFNRIWEIKSGRYGNDLHIKKNPQYNLEKIRVIMNELVFAVNSDIKKNQEFHSKDEN